MKPTTATGNKVIVFHLIEVSQVYIYVAAFKSDWFCFEQQLGSGHDLFTFQLDVFYPAVQHLLVIRQE